MLRDKNMQTGCNIICIMVIKLIARIMLPPV